MAGLTIGQAAVVESRLLPVSGVMALGTLAWIVVGRPRMAGLAIGQAAVVESHLLPVSGFMALGALARVVIGRSVVAVAADAVG